MSYCHAEISFAQEEIFVEHAEFVDEPLNWNGWLLGQIPSAFASCFTSLLASPNVKESEKVAAYSLIPLTDSSRFGGMAYAIRDMLKLQPCLMTSGAALARPDKVLRRGACAIELQFPQSVLPGLLHKAVEEQHTDLFDADHLDAKVMPLSSWMALLERESAWLLGLSPEHYCCMLRQFAALWSSCPPAVKRRLQDVKFVPGDAKGSLIAPVAAILVPVKRPNRPAPKPKGKRANHAAPANKVKVAEPLASYLVARDKADCVELLLTLGMIRDGEEGIARDAVRRLQELIDKGASQMVLQKEVRKLMCARMRFVVFIRACLWQCMSAFITVADCLGPGAVETAAPVFAELRIMLDDGTIAQRDDLIFLCDQRTRVALGNWPGLKVMHEKYADAFKIVGDNMGLR